jgi:hypothetical protein
LRRSFRFQREFDDLVPVSPACHVWSDVRRGRRNRESINFPSIVKAKAAKAAAGASKALIVRKSVVNARQIALRSTFKHTTKPIVGHGAPTLRIAAQFAHAGVWFGRSPWTLSCRTRPGAQLVVDEIGSYRPQGQQD